MMFGKSYPLKPEDHYFKTLNEAQLWERYCGFLDISMDEFLRIQKELLAEEINLVSNSELGKKIMGDRKPSSIEEFRSIVPFTSYQDYEPYLNERTEEVLAAKPYYWCHSAGRGGSFKFIPQSPEVIEKAVRYYIAVAILSSTRKKGKVRIRPGARLLAITAPPPYASGSIIKAYGERFSMTLIPPIDESGVDDFHQKINQGFKMAMREGVDFMGAVASVLVRIGEEFTQKSGGTKISRSMLHPKILFRFFRAWLTAKMAGRGILPKDIWSPKGILVSGVDTSIYKEKSTYYWGVTPLELYGGTESHAYALESWTRKGMVFLPDMVFFEFIPYEESLKLREDSTYNALTVLLDELKEGELYEVVITQFHGMPLLRYRLNDLVKVISLRDEESGIELPHISVQRRVSEVINIGGMADLDERIIWQALVNTGVKFREWTACKEIDGDNSYLRMYIELAEDRDPAEIETMLDTRLLEIDTDYKDIHSYLNLQPVRVTLLSSGTFSRYSDEKTQEGADISHLKPGHISPAEDQLRRLLEISGMNTAQ